MMTRIPAILIFAAALAACGDTPVFSGRNINGNYYLAPDGIGGGERVCLRTSARKCDIRAPGPVDGLGADGEYISVRTGGGGEDGGDYFIIVQLFDSNRADGARCLSYEANRLQKRRKKDKRLTCDSIFKKSVIERREPDCAVRGPLSRDEFEELRLCTCVPENLGSKNRKCVPEVADLLN